MSSTLNTSPTAATLSTGILGDPVVKVLCDRLYKWCGVHMESSKGYLIHNRLRDLIRDTGAKDLADLIRKAESPSGMAVRDRIIDQLTTHETLFFRDQSPFQALATEIVPEIRAATPAGKPRLRIWSAACSSGQEPYSIAMTLCDSITDIALWDVSILASDVSSGTVAEARQGKYQDHELRRGLRADQRKQYFHQQATDWVVSDKLKRMIEFQVRNLCSSNLPTGPYDIIYCRNVLIYFPIEDARRVLKNLATRLAPKGRLFVGCSEVLTEVDDFLAAEPCGRATCYRRTPKSTSN
ncbi:MAG: protein-glutamate O-methyltransferase CheR [Planctomycetota bacterium]